ncbi:helix-turn-helix domain-containing protein [Mesorhizobium sp. LHD-90]|uniref:helix-turn-helix domain-containing protein n=1 Tax=Mesorhizobium sp. LHD-90 TaxID=3071414 RepID=UPI0027E120E7|nr:helix-turn-helix domain-containing protein [Mesorhizobium sp. LHD-90]MDQ6434562.1 helix-turn-helix domain-containing protein [Mesorhizobium sp. LHD-90]
MTNRRDPSPGQQLESMIAGLESFGLHRARIARESGLDKSTITRLARGETRKPSHEVFSKVANLHAKVVLPMPRP